MSNFISLIGASSQNLIDLEKGPLRMSICYFFIVLVLTIVFLSGRRFEGSGQCLGWGADVCQSLLALNSLLRGGTSSSEFKRSSVTECCCTCMHLLQWCSQWATCTWRKRITSSNDIEQDVVCVDAIITAIAHGLFNYFPIALNNKQLPTG